MSSQCFILIHLSRVFFFEAKVHRKSLIEFFLMKMNSSFSLEFFFLRSENPSVGRLLLILVDRMNDFLFQLKVSPMSSL